MAPQLKPVVQCSHVSLNPIGSYRQPSKSQAIDKATDKIKAAGNVEKEKTPETCLVCKYCNCGFTGIGTWPVYIRTMLRGNHLIDAMKKDIAQQATHGTN